MRRLLKSVLSVIAIAALFVNLGAVPAEVKAAAGYPSCESNSTEMFSSPFVSSDPTQVGSAVQITLSAYYAISCNGEIISYEWDLGDGNMATGRTVVHTYNQGNFQPVLTITDDVGKSLAQPTREQVVIKDSNSNPVTAEYEVVVAKKSSFQVDIKDAISDPDDGDKVWVRNPQVTSGNATISDKYRSSSTELYVSGVDTALGDQTITFTYDAEDDFGGVTPGQATIRVDNRAPVVSGSLNYTIDEDTRQYFYVPRENVVTDPDGDPLQYRAETATENGKVQLGYGNGEIYYYPNTDFNGVDNFKIAVSDGNEVSYIDVSVNVLPVNDAPIVPNLSKVVIEEDSAPTTIDPLVGASDVDGDQLKITSVTQPEKGGQVVINGDNTLTFTPEANYRYRSTIWYTVSDGTVDVNKFVIVEMTSVNDIPVINQFNIGTPDKKRSVAFSAFASDIEDTRLNYEWDFGDGIGRVSAQDIKNTSYRYQRKGTYTVTLKVTDSNGAVAVRTGTVVIAR